MTLHVATFQSAKDYGQQLTLDANVEWKHHIMAELRCWIERRKAMGYVTMTFEEFRHEALNHPASHKAWGALASMAKRAGLIEFDRYVKALSVKTHSHPIGLWRFV